jgi:Ca2+-transporting ATPase
MGLPLPLNPIQILFVNFFADSFPAVALAFEEGIDDSGKPRKVPRRLIDREMGFLIFGVGVFTSALLLILYWLLIALDYPKDLVRTFIFATFATYTLFLPFPIRSFRKSMLTYNPFSNHYLTGGTLLGIIMTLIVVYLPLGQFIFKTTALPPIWLAALFGFGLLNILIVELVKFLFRKRVV